MFEDLFRGLMPPQQGAFSPEQMEEFRRKAAMLPAAPSGNFFQVPANSPDRQAGQLLPLTKGQPTTIQQPTARSDAPIFGDMSPNADLGGDAGAFMRGAVGRQAPVAADISSLLNQTAPPASATMSSPMDVFAIPAAGMSPKRGDEGDTSVRDAVIRAGGNPDFTRVDNLDRGPNSPTGHAANLLLTERDLSDAKKLRMADTSTEGILRRAGEFASEAPYDARLGYMGNVAARENATRMFLGLQGQERAQADRMQLQALENQGRMDVAGVTSRANQFGELDKSELHIRDAVGKGLLDKQTGQAMIDTINARRSSIGAGPGGAASGSTMSPPISAGADVNNLRSLFGQVGPTGQFSANPAAATGQTFSQLIDKIDPSMSPQVVAAIRSGQFGDPAAIKNAAYNSLAQNYMMSQGQMAGGQTAAADLVNGGRGGQIPGRYTIPYGPNNKPLLDLIASPPSNVVDSIKKKAGFAQSGVPYDMIRLPDGTQIPFDQSGVQGISNMSSTLGYNQGARTTAQQRLSKLAQLVDMLQSTQSPR